MDLQVFQVIFFQPTLTELHMTGKTLIRFPYQNPGLEVITLDYSLRLKIKCNDWLLADTVLKFYNLEARVLFLYVPNCHTEN